MVSPWVIAGAMMMLEPEVFFLTMGIAVDGMAFLLAIANIFAGVDVPASVALAIFYGVVLFLLFFGFCFLMSDPPEDEEGEW